MGIAGRTALGLSAAGALFVALAALAWYSASRLGSEWEHHNVTISTRLAISTTALESLGNATTAFKNFILRGGDHAEEFATEIGRVEGAAEAYSGTGQISDEERAHLESIRVGVAEYRKAMETVVAIRQVRKDPAELDKLARNPERPIRVALRALASANREAYELKGGEISAFVNSAKKWLLIIVAPALMLLVMFGLLLTRSITRPVGDAVRVAERVASGDLTSRIEASGEDEAAKMLQALRRMNDGLAEIVNGVRASADEIAAASGEIVRGNGDMSRRTESQASHLEETAASMEELTATVKQNAENATVANRHASAASTVAGKGREMMGQIVATMDGISGSSNRIQEIIGVIDGIAFQTNILALNAAVEAARAGEQGRGFAVVASEVRSLAQRSAEAAKEIKALIADSTQRVGSGASLVGEAGKTMDEIVSSVEKVQRLISDIAAASGEQRSGIEQVSRAVQEMEKMTQQNAALVEQSAAAAESLDEHAQRLARSVEVFKTEEEAPEARRLSESSARLLPS